MIIEKLQSGIIPWKKTWTTAYPKNFVSGLEYKGINILLLGLQDFESNYWLTFKQTKDLNGSIKSGEHASLVVFYKPVVYIKDNELDEATADVSFLLRYYYVFNIAQCNLPDEVLKRKNIMQTNPKIMEAEDVIKKYRNPPEVCINNTISCPRYIPKLDKIEIMSINNFKTSDDYYASLFHEYGHSTGNRNRLNRKSITDSIHFGSADYSREELVAELFSAFICNLTGITLTLNNSVSYIQNWLNVLKNDNRFIVIAASQASKAVDYVLGNISSPNSKED